jgi:hypothetical protein
MTTTLLLLVLMAEVGVQLPGVEVPATQIPGIAAASYENFMKVEPGSRVGLFHRLTRWNRATLMREHLERWRQQNADRLSQEQLSAVAEYGALVEQLVSGTRTARDRERGLKERFQKLFTPSELEQVSVLTGTYIP